VSCAHLHTAPVVVQPDAIAAALGDTADATVVAHLCAECLASLPVNWGCPDCEWVDARAIGDAVPHLIPGQPCTAHGGSL